MNKLQYLPVFHSQMLNEMIKKYIPCQKFEIIGDDIYIHSKTAVKKFHWFQFCLTVLAEKVVQYNAQNIGTLAYTAMLGTEHPIEMLYRHHKNGQFYGKARTMPTRKTV